MYMYIHMFIHIHIYKYINILSALSEMLRTSAHERGALAWGGFVLYPKWGPRVLQNKKYVRENRQAAKRRCFGVGTV